MATGMLVRAKILRSNTPFHASMDVQPVTPCNFSLKIIYVSKRLKWAFSSVSINYFLLCPVVNREIKFAFT